VATKRKSGSGNTRGNGQLPSYDGAASNARVLGPAIRWVNSKFASLARSLAVDNFIQFDRYAIWFYVLYLAVFGIASLANLNGSSTGFYRKYGYAPQKAPLLGVARGIRSDEWTVPLNYS